MISIDRVDKFYDDYHALSQVSLDIRAGEFFSLLGPSGCGKTTLLRVIAGFEDVDQGSLTIDGRPMLGVPANKRPTNMVFQSYAIFPHLSVAQNVAFGLRRRRDLDASAKSAAVSETLEMVGLAGYGKRAAHALSGGQRQRVALARALVLRPKVLLLDEPLSALDRKMREQMQSELRRLQRLVGITFVLVTHDQEEALIMSDRIAVMFDGQIAQIARPEELYRRPVNRRVGEFIGVMNFLPATRSGEDMFEIAGLGAVRLKADQINGATGGAIVMGIRPETMSVLIDEEPRGGRSAEATVSDLAYYGDMTYYDLRLDGVDQPITISMKNLMSRRILEREERVRIVWDERALLAFPA